MVIVCPSRFQNWLLSQISLLLSSTSVYSTAFLIKTFGVSLFYKTFK